MTQEYRIKGKFYALQEDEWVEIWNQLKPAEVGVLILLRTMDPFGDQVLQISVTGIGKRLGMHKGTVSRALKKLNERGWIDLELVQVNVKLKSVSHKQHRCPQTTVLPTDNTVSQEQPPQPVDNPDNPQTTPITHRQHQEAETPSQQDSQIPKTNKTLKLKTLSKREREKFKNFCRRRGDEMPEKVILLDSWIEAHFEELYSMWQEASGQGNSSALPVPGQKNNSAAESEGKNSTNSEIHPAIVKGLKEGTLLEYDRYLKMVKIKGDKLWTHEQDYLAIQEWDSE